MVLEPLPITGPDVMLPGSDFLLAGVGRLLLLIGVVGFVAGLIVRRLGKRRLAQANNGSGATASPGAASPGAASPGAASPGAASPAPKGRRPIFVMGFGIAALIGLALSVIYRPPPFEAPILPALPRLLPEQAFFYSKVTDLPVAAESDRWIASQKTIKLGAAFGSTVYQGWAPGIPFNPVTSQTRRIDVHLTQFKEGSFQGPYPIADPPYIENFPVYGGDQHYLAIDVDERRAWELIAFRRWFSRWEAGAGSTWSMDELTYPIGSTIAAGLPLLPGMVTYDEVAAGSVDHMILIGTSISARGKFVWPARGSDGISDDPDAPPMGAWLRLKSTADLSELGPQAKIIATAAQTYGVMISDTGPGFGMRGTADRRWDPADLHSLQTLTTDDFEAVDASSLMVSTDSMEARPSG
ncbi:MAG: hypothetical protein WBA45_00100 [Microthrixaceae bacterium]